MSDLDAQRLRFAKYSNDCWMKLMLYGGMTVALVMAALYLLYQIISVVRTYREVKATLERRSNNSNS